MTPDLLSPVLREQAERVIGPARFQLVHQWTPDSSVIWRADTQDAAYSLKVHAASEKYRQELAAYRDWLPRADGLAAPSLVAAFEGTPPALLLSWAPGKLFGDMKFASLGEELAVFELAGDLLKRLHALQPGSSGSTNLSTTVREKILRRSHTLRGELPDLVLDWARSAASSPEWDNGIPAGYCHRDFSPRNWIIDVSLGSPRVTLIDFEHAAVDYLAMDVMKLWDGPFVGRADRRRAFYAGYGRRIEEDAPFVRLLAAAHGLAIVDWSLRNSRSDYLAHGRQFLQRAATGDAWMWE